MKSLLIALSILFAVTSCKSDKKADTQTFEKELTVGEKIAQANGFENWKNVSQIDFTFNVDRDTTHFERSWSWKPKTGDVTLISDKDTISFNRKAIDSLSLNADQGFINDKYWLLAPYQLVWDSSATISEPSYVEAPISKSKMNKITITYSQEGGYTPGDAYDFYFDKDYMIREWGFRKGNSEKASVITTWEDYEDFDGIKLSKTRKRAEGNWKLHFTKIKVSK